MKVLISPHFNSAMLRLDTAAQKETSQLFSLASALTREQLLESPLLTKLTTSEEMFTLRGGLVRIFCALDANGDVIFLDVRQVGASPVQPERPKNGEVTLFGKSGEPQAYIAYGDESTIYSFSGDPLAYVDDNCNIYGFNGHHLGWFEDDIIWDHRGRRVGYTAKSCPAFRKFEPFKGFKRFKPFKGFKQFAPFKPLKSTLQSAESLLEFLQSGRK
jgi:hypothetical protein